MSTFDDLVEKAARALVRDSARSIGREPTEAEIDYRMGAGVRAEARAALLAVGLPALLERVEAAEGARNLRVEECKRWKSEQGRLIHERDMARAETSRLMEGQRDANALARRLADALGERDTAIEDAEAATSTKHQTENDLSSQIVTLELKLEDVTADRDALAAKVAGPATVDSWRHARWAEPHEGHPVKGTVYIQPGTKAIEAKCETCSEAIIGYHAALTEGTESV